MSFVTVSNRPQLTFEETELNFLNKKMWVPGKSVWNDMNITYPDIENDEGGALFFRWVSEQYKSPSESPHQWSAESACVILRLHDGCGVPMELWYLEDALLTSFDFGMNAVGESELNVGFKYRDADYVNPDPATWLKPLTESSSSC